MRDTGLKNMPTDISEKTPILTNLRAIVLAVAAIACGAWYVRGWMGDVSAKLDTHSTAISAINSQLAELKTNQKENFERLYSAIRGRETTTYPASAPLDAKTIPAPRAD